MKMHETFGWSEYDHVYDLQRFISCKYLKIYCSLAILGTFSLCMIAIVNPTIFLNFGNYLGM